nr:hypothetical protein [uncultured Pseudomonas sp.]
MGAAAAINNGVVTGIYVIDDNQSGADFAEMMGWVIIDPTSEISIGWLYDGSQFTPPPVVVYPVETYQVDEERDRRTAMGFVYDGKAYQTENQSQIDDILGKMTDALAAITIDQAQPGDLRWASPDYDFAWSAADGTLVPMDAQTCLAFTRSAVRRKTLLVGAGLALKAMNPIPTDYMDDKYWPPLDSTAKTARK